MQDVPSPDPPVYRLGYREGFRDGFADAQRSLAQENTQQVQNPDKDQDSQDKDKDKDKDREENGGHAQPLYKRPVIVAVALALVLLLIIGGIIFWRHSRHHESTDDAFIDGQTTELAAQTAGRVAKLYITDNQWVNAGDPLLDIDSRDNDARIAQSRAQLAAAQGQHEQASAQIDVGRAGAEQADAAARQSEAQWRQAAADLAKYRSVDPDAVSRQQVDAARATERTARAQWDASRMSARAARAQIQAAVAMARAADSQVEAARAGLNAAQLQGSYTHVVAPIAGRVTRRSVELGNVIANGQALMGLVSTSLWVTANYKETQLTRMRPGQPVQIVVDAYPDVKFHGKVDSIQRATGAYFSTLPAENATGNYVKVVQRVPVKIVFDDQRVNDYVIGPGMSVTPNVSLP